MNKKRETIVYVNFSPYSNAGHILEYLNESYQTVVHFTFRFHHLGKSQIPPNVSVYINGQIKQYFPIFQFPAPPSFAFILLPIRSILFLFQIIFHLVLLKKKFGPYTFYFTVNSFTAWIGNLLREFGLVSKTIYWVWDYYPLHHPNKIVQMMRKIYWWFDSQAVCHSDKVIFLSHKIRNVHFEKGNIRSNDSHTCVGIGTKLSIKTKKHTGKKTTLVFFGVLKKSEGLDLVLDSFSHTSLLSKSIVLHIIGSGPDREYFEEKALKHKVPVVFHGYLPNDADVDTILSSADIGLAPYQKDPEHVAQYTDPSKIKRYLGFGLPVITTRTTDLADQIHHAHAGIVIDYSQQALLSAVSQITKKKKYYSLGSLKLAKQFEYHVLYDQLFFDL